MPTLSIPSNLLRSSSRVDVPAPASRREIALEPGPWDHLAAQLRSQFPDLSAHVLVESGELARGFALVVDGRPVRDCRSVQFSGDETLAIIPYIAGG